MRRNKTGMLLLVICLLCAWGCAWAAEAQTFTIKDQVYTVPEKWTYLERDEELDGKRLNIYLQSQREDGSQYNGNIQWSELPEADLAVIRAGGRQAERLYLRYHASKSGIIEQEMLALPRPALVGRWADYPVIPILVLEGNYIAAAMADRALPRGAQTEETVVKELLTIFDPVGQEVEGAQLAASQHVQEGHTFTIPAGWLYLPGESSDTARKWAFEEDGHLTRAELFVGILSQMGNSQIDAIWQETQAKPEAERQAYLADGLMAYLKGAGENQSVTVEPALGALEGKAFLLIRAPQEEEELEAFAAVCFSAEADFLMVATVEGMDGSMLAERGHSIALSLLQSALEP